MMDKTATEVSAEAQQSAGAQEWTGIDLTQAKAAQANISVKFNWSYPGELAARRLLDLIIASYKDGAESFETIRKMLPVEMTPQQDRALWQLLMMARRESHD